MNSNKEIPDHIDDSEILVRWIFADALKNKARINDFLSGDVTLIKDQNVFIDTRGGVSLQRFNYTNREASIELGKSIKHLICLAKFSKSLFFSLLSEFKVTNNLQEFNAKIIFTPMDSENNNILKRPIFVNDLGNPSHSEIKYINPSLETENPNTFIRLFSRLLFQHCEKDFVK